MTRLLLRSCRAFGAAGLLMLSLTGCKKVVEVEAVDALTLVSGGSQVRQAGRLLPAPLVFRATSAGGAALGAATITIVIVQGGGAVDSASIKTDENGEARVKWTLGPGATLQVLQASVPDVEPLVVTATGIVPSDIVIAQGNNQSARIGVALTNSVVVRVLGANNTPMDSINVTFQITGGGGAIAPQSILTNASGEATVKWTMGPVAGANTALVRASTIDPVTISATATP
ncbi:MAG: Ig-like domain-containing protein [Gemmatimonadota bacterium]